MALTPEDVVNKRFNPTKFREGYDQDEVDDFLDEVVVELRRLNQENEELRQRLMAADARVSEMQRSASQPPVAQPQQPVAAPMAAPVSMPIPVQQPQAPAPDFGAQDAGGIDQSNTNNLLQLARRLHEEHVREGMEKRDQLIAEGHATAARLVSEAEAQQRTAIETLTAERAELERRVEELRIFESEYRDQLKGYIESQLRELEAAAPLAAPAEPVAEAAPAAAAYEAPVYEAPAAYEAPTAYEAPASYGAPAEAPTVAAPPMYEAPATPSVAPEYAAPYGQAPAAAQNPAPQPASASVPPAYAGFPAPQPAAAEPAAEFGVPQHTVDDYLNAQQPQQQPGAEYPAPQQPEQQQPEYPAYSQRNSEYPGFGGN